jgi:serine/threonine-protein kinase
MTTDGYPAMPEVGDVLDGRYQLLRGLGHGAAGAVYEARHLFTGRFVAVKVMLPQVRHSELAMLRARLEREGRALAAVQHPGVVEVFDGGLTPEGFSYLVMEMLEGCTLEGLLAARGKLSAANTAGLTLQLCDALDAVHAAGVVHRDVKPSNIIVVRARDGSELVKLLDFGMVKLLEPAPADKLTQAGAILGTPAYMAPEQLLADVDIDERADVYSLGVIMFECLSGTIPHEGNYAKVLLGAAGSGQPPSLLSRAPEVPAPLAHVVERAMARFPAERFATARELAAAIERALPGATPSTTLRSAPARAAKVTPPEQRRLLRAPYNTPVRLVVREGMVDGRAENISEGGLLVLTLASCSPEQRISIRFALPLGGKVVSVEAVVRWVRLARGVDRQGMNAIGVAFHDLPSAVRQAIARYVALMSEAEPSPGCPSTPTGSPDPGHARSRRVDGDATTRNARPSAMARPEQRAPLEEW